MNIKPFKFKLQKVSEREERVLSALYDFLPKTGMREKFHGAILDALKEHLNADVNYKLETVTQTEFEKFCLRLPDPTVVVVLGIPPREGKIIVEIDSHLANLFIERLLGGNSEAIFTPKQLSDTEQGVLQYLVLQILSHIYRICGQDGRLHFRFEKFAFNSKELKGVLSPDESISVLTIKNSVDQKDGFVRIAFPSPLVEQLYLNVKAKDEARKAEQEYLLGRINDFDFVRLSLWAEAGYTAISTADLSNLEEGDVILFDRTDMSLTDKGPSGAVILRTGEGVHGGFKADIDISDKKIKCKIVDVYEGEDII